MATVKVVNGQVLAADSTPRIGVLIKAKLSQPVTIAGTQEVVPLEVTTKTALDGSYSLSLFSNSDLAPAGTYYTITEDAQSGDLYQYAVVVPGTAGPFNAASIQVAPLAPPPVNGHVSTLLVDGQADFPSGPVNVPDGSFTEAKVANLVSDLAAKAADSAVVHKTGAEAVAGVKTFSSAPVVPAAAFPESAVASLVADLAALSADDANAVHKTGNETIAGIKNFTGPIDLTQQATPAAPAAGVDRIYAKADGRFYRRTSAVGEVPLYTQDDAIVDVGGQVYNVKNPKWNESSAGARDGGAKGDAKSFGDGTFLGALPNPTYIPTFAADPTAANANMPAGTYKFAYTDTNGNGETRQNPNGNLTITTTGPNPSVNVTFGPIPAGSTRKIYCISGPGGTVGDTGVTASGAATSVIVSQTPGGGATPPTVNGSATSLTQFSSQLATFNAATDVGKVIWIATALAVSNGINRSFVGTIATVIDAHNITLNTAAQSAVAGGVFAYGTDDRAAIQAAWDAAGAAANASGQNAQWTTLLFPPGGYMAGRSGVFQNIPGFTTVAPALFGWDKVAVVGAGATLISSGAPLADGGNGTCLVVMTNQTSHVPCNNWSFDSITMNGLIGAGSAAAQEYGAYGIVGGNAQNWRIKNCEAFYFTSKPWIFIPTRTGSALSKFWFQNNHAHECSSNALGLGQVTTVGTIASVSAGATSLIYTLAQSGTPLVGEQFIIDLDLPTEETVTASAVSGSGPYTLTVAPTLYAHGSAAPMQTAFELTDFVIADNIAHDQFNEGGAEAFILKCMRRGAIIGNVISRWGALATAGSQSVADLIVGFNSVTTSMDTSARCMEVGYNHRRVAYIGNALDASNLEVTQFASAIPGGPVCFLDNGGTNLGIIVAFNLMNAASTKNAYNFVFAGHVGTFLIGNVMTGSSASQSISFPAGVTGPLFLALNYIANGWVGNPPNAFFIGNYIPAASAPGLGASSIMALNYFASITSQFRISGQWELFLANYLVSGDASSLLGSFDANGHRLVALNIIDMNGHAALMWNAAGDYETFCLNLIKDAGTGVNLGAGQHSKVFGNIGALNPKGSVSLPGFPATTVAVTNTTFYDVWAYITAGTATVSVVVSGKAGNGGTIVIPANALCPVFWPAGETLTPTYASGTPSYVGYAT